jgi:cell division protein FtsX
MFAFLTSSFLMSGMLVALAGVSIPIIIHLLHRQRTQPIQWGAMQFLLVSPLQQKRRKTVEHWLLMLLRMLLIALVVLMLARMLAVNGKYNPLGSNMATDVGIVIDHSLSTGRRTGDRTVFETASRRPACSAATTRSRSCWLSTSPGVSRRSRSARDGCPMS